jgi:opacity protein-like surface antigen
MKKLLLLPLIAFLFSPIFVQAQDNTTGSATVSTDYNDGAAIQNTIGIGPRLGFYKADDADDGNFYGGLQIRGRIGPVFGIELAAEYHTEQAFGVDNFQADTRLIPVTGSALLFIPISDYFAPYGVAGLGAYYTIYNYPDDATDVGLDDFEEFNLGYHLGFGVEVPFSSNVALNVDYRYIYLNPDDNEENLEGANFDGNTVTAGLMFYF